MTKLEESMLKNGDIVVKDNKQFMFHKWLNSEGINHHEFMKKTQRVALILDKDLNEIKTELFNYE